MPQMGVLETSNNPHIEYRYVLINRRTKMVYHQDGDILYIDTFWDTRMNPQTLLDELN